MEECTQITLDEWMQWKEDIRAKLQETAGNFVYIGYRLKQIRDSGMFDGAADIFEFASREYGLGKSTVSRFIAINEKFSEGGNSLELREEFRRIGSSKLSEMLTLPDAECLLITERTTVKEIRDLKNLGRQQESGGLSDEYTPLEKCIIDFFSDEKRREALNKALDAETEEDFKAAAEAINPGGYATHKKGIVFMFLYDYNKGMAYKSMAENTPQSLSWQQFIEMVQELYASVIYEEDAWAVVYGKKQEQKIEEKPENTGAEAVATSQQEEPSEEPEEETEEGETEGENEEDADDDDQEEEASEEDESDAAVGEDAGEDAGDQEQEDEPGDAESGAPEDGGEPREGSEQDSGEAMNPPEVIREELLQLQSEANRQMNEMIDLMGWGKQDVEQMPLWKLMKIQKLAEDLGVTLKNLMAEKEEEDE